ncbi:MAG: DUF3857 domain-containing transglutaminase family protein [Steroidobacter sp.]
MRMTINAGYAAVCAVLASLISSPALHAADHAPDWMQALKAMPVPAHDEKADAVNMYSDLHVTLKADGTVLSQERVAYKILRPDSPHAIVSVPFDDRQKIVDMRAWSIPVQGKDYMVKEKDAMTIGSSVDFALVADDKTKRLQIPAADPGAIVGYEVQLEERPYFQEAEWTFSEDVPVREATYTLQLPAGWSFKAFWRNHAAQDPVKIANNQWQWTVSDIKAVKHEDDMPPFNALAQQLQLQLIPAQGEGRVLASWRDLGNWYLGLTSDRRVLTPGISQEVTGLTGTQTTLLGKMQALARFAQGDIRYVAISLGIGGLQPHAAADIFANRYGDCKDKATLLSTMLKQIGVDSYYVIINAEHDVVPADALPSTNWFNHAILAIQLPASMKDVSFPALSKHPVLGNILYFDPTNEFIPFGQLPGYLQGNHAMLVRADGTELVTLPVQNASTSGRARSATLVLNDRGQLSGQVTERLTGYTSFMVRSTLQKTTLATERQKIIERKLADAFSAFSVTGFKINNEADITQPLEYQYSFAADKYAKSAGDMLIVRPRILGSEASAILETTDKRENPVEYVSLQKDTDDFTVSLPAGYVADDLPAPVDADYPFASYHSKAEVKGNTLHYTRTFEIKQFMVPADKLDDLKKFYRAIYNDERANAVLVRKDH